MKLNQCHLVMSVVAACFLVSSSPGEEITAPQEPVALLKQISQEIEKLPESPTGLAENLSALQESVEQLESGLLEARQSEATAHARMASWTGAILARELKKVHASSRLIEITEKTGRTEEVARYRERHQRLLDTIADTTAHYESIIRHLGSLDSGLVDAGFKQYQQYLIGKELASQLGLHRVVRSQFEQYRNSRKVDLPAWQEELLSR